MGKFEKDSNIVVIFPDHGSRYMSKIYSDKWMENQGFLGTEVMQETQSVEIIK
jgi:cystathionine beta-synthase